MNTKENRETSNPAILIEDLSAEPGEALQVKGGRYTVVLQDCLISSYHTSGGGE